MDSLVEFVEVNEVFEEIVKLMSDTIQSITQSNASYRNADQS